jgi:hypothetical protein
MEFSSERYVGTQTGFQLLDGWENSNAAARNLQQSHRKWPPLPELADIDVG